MSGGEQSCHVMKTHEQSKYKHNSILYEKLMVGQDTTNKNVKGYQKKVGLLEPINEKETVMTTTPLQLRSIHMKH